MGSVTSVVPSKPKLKEPPVRSPDPVFWNVVTYQTDRVGNSGHGNSSRPGLSKVGVGSHSTTNFSMPAPPSLNGLSRVTRRESEYPQRTYAATPVGGPGICLGKVIDEGAEISRAPYPRTFFVDTDTK